MAQHNYTWSFDDSEDNTLPEELEQLETVEYETRKIEFGFYDGDVFGALDGVEFVMGFPVARYGMEATDDNEYTIEADDLNEADKALISEWYDTLNDDEQD